MSDRWTCTARWSVIGGVPHCCLLLVFSLGLALGSCGPSSPDPKDTVKEMFAAMERSDTLQLSRLIDLPSAAQNVRADLAPSQPGESEPDWGQLLLASMTGEGVLRKRWLENQIVLGASQVLDDSALVEVSFLDRLTRVQYYNKMRLVYRDGRWVITSFRTM
ncbi:MAG: hypothetical protein AB1792_02685 [Candidatus Zixiibacteriota bacterium]